LAKARTFSRKNKPSRSLRNVALHKARRLVVLPDIRWVVPLVVGRVG
jgi:hypothetical protein